MSPCLLPTLLAGTLFWLSLNVLSLGFAFCFIMNRKQSRARVNVSLQRAVTLGIGVCPEPGGIRRNISAQASETFTLNPIKKNSSPFYSPFSVLSPPL